MVYSEVGRMAAFRGLDRDRRRGGMGVEHRGKIVNRQFNLIYDRPDL